ncbi:MAG: hemerythrin domain-containing protein [Polyangiaceae bacterium]
MPTKPKKSKKSSKKKSKSAPTALLEKQHRVVEGIFKKLEKGGGDAKALLKELADNLAAHMSIEQDIYYPAVKKVDEDLVLESYEEHSMAELGLKRLLATKTSDQSFKSRVTAVKELIEHHVEEEEDDLFPHVDKKLSADLLEDLGAKMKAQFEAVKASGFAKAVPKGFDETSADVSQQ